MKFSIDSAVLKTEIGLMQSIAEKKSGILVLASVLIESIGMDKIKITATDLDTTLITEVEAVIAKEGSICVPAKKMYDIAKNLPMGDTVFTKNANSWVDIKCGTTKFKIHGIGVDQFPDVAVPESSEFTINGKDLKDLVTKTCFAVSNEESRFALGGAKLEIADGFMTMTATDGHRIATTYHPTDETEDLDVLIPKKALTEVVRFAGEKVTIQNSPNLTGFTSGHRTLITRKLTLPFPDYRGAIPKDYKIKVEFNLKDFLVCLKRVAVMADETSRSVKIELLPDSLKLFTNVDGEAEETVKCKIENYPKNGLSFFINWQYLTDYLNICSNPVFKLKTATSLIEVSEGNSMYLAMPMRG